MITVYEEGIETKLGDRVNVVTCDPAQTGYGYPGLNEPHTLLQFSMANGQQFEFPLPTPVGDAVGSGEKLVLLIAQSAGLIRVGTSP